MEKPELKFAIDAAAGIFGYGIVREAVGGEALAAAHDVHKRAPLAIVCGKLGPQEQVVLLNAYAVKAAAIEHRAEVRMARQRKIFEGSVPSTKGVSVGGDDIDTILVSNTDINVTTRKNLRPRRGGKENYG